jgi:ABC-type sulfate/molybdate transport systems ATPase subunit
MPKAQHSFNHKKLSDQLFKRLQRHFDNDEVINDSLVIGIFGEWGSGKSNQLHLIHESF